MTTTMASTDFTIDNRLFRPSPYHIRLLARDRQVPVWRVEEGHACPDCGRWTFIGDWPICPHGSIGIQFNVKDSTPSHAYYYIDPEDGTIGIPPDPSLAPEGMELIRVDSARHAEKLQKQMAEQEYGRWQDDGHFSQMMEEVLGNPRQTLVDQMAHPKSQLEKDTIPLLLEHLDKEEKDRTKVEADVKFEFMGKD